MSHRRAGVKGIQRQRQTREAFKSAGEALQESQIRDIKATLESFKSNLERFAQNHRTEILQDPIFRSQFQKMCAQVGVDPLASNKNYWASLLGFGDFYYEVSVQIAQVCMQTRDQNGGLVGFYELMKHVSDMRGKHAQPISEDDIIQSIKCLRPLGDGFSVVMVGNKKMVRSVPEELSIDHSKILALCDKSNFLTVRAVIDAYGWSEERAASGITELVQQSVLWIDEQDVPHSYWITGMYF